MDLPVWKKLKLAITLINISGSSLWDSKGHNS